MTSSGKTRLNGTDRRSKRQAKPSDRSRRDSSKVWPTFSAVTPSCRLRAPIGCPQRLVPRLLMKQGIAWFFREHRGQPVTSAALMSPMSRAFVSMLDGFAERHHVPVVEFRKGKRKDEVTTKHLRQFAQGRRSDFFSARLRRSTSAARIPSGCNRLRWPLRRPLAAIAC